MRYRGSISALCALSCGLLFSTSIWAQGRRGGPMGRSTHEPREERQAQPDEKKTPIDVFETMSPADQQKALDRLPPAQRKKLEERLQRFNQLPTAQQQALRNLYNRLHELPPQRQETVRKALNKLSEQVPDRQQAVREEFRSLAALAPPERQARLSSPEFRSRFSKKEQEILRDMAPLLR